MIPWLLVLEVMSRSGRKPLSDLVAERMARFPCSGEINRTLAGPRGGPAAGRGSLSGRGHRVGPHRRPQPGISDWRFNLRTSNTEPVLRLNVETRQDPALLKAKTAELLALMT